MPKHSHRIEAGHSIKSIFLKGLLKLFVLSSCEDSPAYGFEIAKELRLLGYDISQGTLYPVLNKLEKAGYLTRSSDVVNGRVRHYYELTSEGKACLAGLREDLGAVVRRLFAI